MTIEQLSVKVLSQLDLKTDIANDIIGLSIVSIIGYKSLQEIMLTTNFPEDKEFDSIEVINHLNHTKISELIETYLQR